MKGLVSCTRKPQLSRATSTEHRMSLRHLLLGRKAVINLDSILKSRDSTLLTKVRLVQAMVFPVVPYGCGSWTIMKAEYQRIDAFELWCWRKLLRVPWTARKSNQSILKEISPGWSLEGSMLKLKLPILRPPDAKSWLIDLLAQDPAAGKDEREEEKGMTEDEMAGWHHQLGGHGSGWTPGVGDGQRGLACCGPWGCKESDTTEWLNWTELSLRGSWLHRGKAKHGGPQGPPSLIRKRAHSSGKTNYFLGLKAYEKCIMEDLA